MTKTVPERHRVELERSSARKSDKLQKMEFTVSANLQIREFVKSIALNVFSDFRFTLFPQRGHIAHPNKRFP
jgi:hypothetical protein